MWRDRWNVYEKFGDSLAATVVHRIAREYVLPLTCHTYLRETLTSNYYWEILAAKEKLSGYCELAGEKDNAFADMFEVKPPSLCLLFSSLNLTKIRYTSVHWTGTHCIYIRQNPLSNTFFDSSSAKCSRFYFICKKSSLPHSASIPFAPRSCRKITRFKEQQNTTIQIFISTNWKLFPSKEKYPGTSVPRSAILPTSE